MFALEEESFSQDNEDIYQTYAPSDISGILKQKLQSGPSWIHGNLVHYPKGKSVIVLSFGADVGNDNPATNVSYDDK